MQLLSFIFGLIVLILVHELGHFLAARLLKVDVEEFGIGFPPRMVKLFERNGTIYSLNWIPLGGFVRLRGENDPSIPGSLAAASPWVRLGVMFAGPLMNLAAGILLGTLFYNMVGDPKPLILKVAPDSPAQEASLLAGDLITRVNDHTVTTTGDLQSQIYAALGKPTQITYLRDGQSNTITLTPRSNPPEGEGAMGIELSPPQHPISLDRAAYLGGREVYNYIRTIVLLPVRVLSGQARPEESRLGGYKLMYDIYQRADPIWFFMMISASLGIMNLLPIPALDGGRILLTMPEIIFHRRVPPEYENAIHLVGFVLLLLLLIYINIQDFLNPIQLP